MSTLAIIPARGGSKGIPRKNVQPLAGKPLLAWNIEAARGARAIDRVVVSTDDEEIAAVARTYGAEVVHRPAEISGDSATSEAALLHTLEHLGAIENYHPELVVFLQCTSPLTAAADIDQTVATLRQQNADTALAATEFHYFIWDDAPDGGAVGINHDQRVRPRRQDRPAQYLETGAVYVMKATGFLQAKHRFFGKTAIYVMPRDRVMEIDEPVDFIIAETLMRRRNQREAARLLPAHVGGIVFDFDGVFTDNAVLVREDGGESVRCSRGDGMGIAELRALGIPMLVLSTEEHPVVAARCAKLKLPCQQACADKAPALRTWAKQQGIELATIVYVGNDINDLDCLRAVGCGVAVGDAHPSAKAAARLVLNEHGGNGAVRELADYIVEARGKHTAGR